MTRVLFVCVRNAGKSRMAAGLFAGMTTAGDGIEVCSAGTAAGSAVNAESVASLAEVGIDIAAGAPRQLTAQMIAAADLVITVGAEAEVPEQPGTAFERWETDEPSERGVQGAERMRLIRDELADRAADLYQRLTTSPS